jgi:hypothetical protein
MNHPVPTFIAVLAVPLAAIQSAAQVPRDITLKITDEIGQPVVGAEAEITVERIGGRSENKGLTDETGVYAVSVPQTLAGDIFVKKSGHHGIRLIDISRYQIPTGKVTLDWVLPRVLQPTALYALQVSLQLPAQSQWLDYDLQAGDWLPPHGKGKVADVRFRYRATFAGYMSDGANLERSRELSRISAERRGEHFSEEEFRKSAGHWIGTLEVSFPGDKEGVRVETKRYWYYSQLRLPHLAPEAGFEPSLRYEATTQGSRPPEKRVGYYLRTRVKLDEAGRIVSANYGKIYEDIRFDARYGTVTIWYYFNPTPNDRNLEFDPARNLFPQSMRGANVANP